MSKVTPPKYVRQILKNLQSRGHRAYLVGGCVRDMILSVQPNDWDICTSALPEAVLEIFPGSETVGIKHGTVAVKLGSRTVEVTTFRSEGRYTDHRHPEDVSFVSDLTTDLRRRDFTMNAIAVSADGFVSDPFGGVQDIEKRIIRCVGEPELRFEEDALRMFRALRFSARLGFEIEPESYAAIAKKAHLAGEISSERVQEEVEKLLMTKRPEMVMELIELGLMDSYLIRRLPEERKEADFSAVPMKNLQRWAALSVYLEHYECIRSVEDFLSSLRLDSRTVRCCSEAAAIYRGVMPRNNAEWKRLLNRCGVDAVSCAAAVQDFMQGGKSSQRALKAVLKSGECFSMKHLAVSGDDLLEMGFEGRALGDMLQFLLDYVIEYPDNNRRELLLSLAVSTEE